MTAQDTKQGATTMATVTVTRYGKTFTFTQTDKRAVANYRGTCTLCGAGFVAGTPRAYWTCDETGRGEFGCVDCGAVKAAPVTRAAKRAKFASTCPGCGLLIEAGAPLMFDTTISKYVSDCCA